MQITFTIPDEKIQRVIDAIKGLFPVPIDENGDPLYTDSQWAKEKIRQFIIDSVYQYEQNKAQDEAMESIKTDNSLVS